MDARELLLTDHARIHSRVVTGGADLSMEDGLCDGLTDEQFRCRPAAGLNSVAWLLRHLTRVEDVVVNTLVRGAPEVLDRAGWLDRLRVEARHVGTGSGDDEVGDLSDRVELAALRAYRAAVGRETRLCGERGARCGEIVDLGSDFKLYVMMLEDPDGVQIELAAPHS